MSEESLEIDELASVEDEAGGECLGGSAEERMNC